VCHSSDTLQSFRRCVAGSDTFGVVGWGAFAVVVGVAGMLCLHGCAETTPAAKLAKAPEFTPEGQTKCGVKASQAHPLIVEWPSSDRAALEAHSRHGLIAVRYSGCEMELLDQCSVTGHYGYVPITTKHDRVTIKDEDDLYANVPLGAARLEGKLHQAGELNVTMTIVGRLEADRNIVKAEELQGVCGKATHVVVAMTVGAFDFFAGADASVGGSATVLGAGGGGKNDAHRETLAQDGDDAACAKATSQDGGPPFGCGAMLRLEVVPLVGSPLLAGPQGANGGDLLEAIQHAEVEKQRREAQAEDEEAARAQSSVRVLAYAGMAAGYVGAPISFPANVPSSGIAGVQGFGVGPTLGAGIRYRLAPRVDLQARIGGALVDLAHSGANTSTDDCAACTAVRELNSNSTGLSTLWQATFDATIRGRMGEGPSPWWIGLGPLVGYQSAGQVSLISNGPPSQSFGNAPVPAQVMVGGLLEMAFLFGAFEQWEFDLRYAMGVDLGADQTVFWQGIGAFSLGLGYALR
jgi:hypothetical protein